MMTIREFVKKIIGSSPIITQTIFVAVLAFALVSCAQISGGSDDDINLPSKTGKAKVAISLAQDSDESGARTVLPSEGSIQDFSDFEFFKKASGESDFTSLATWNTYDDFYKNTKEFDFDAGTYTFKLTAKRYGATFLGYVSGKLETDKKYTFPFKLSIDENNTTKTGYLNVSFAITSSSTLYDSVSKITATLGTNEESELEITESNSSTWDYASSSRIYIYTKTVAYKSESAEEGNYLLTFKAYNDSGAVIFTYPTYVIVQAGYPSSKSISVGAGEAISESSAAATSVTITYNSNYSDSTENKTYEQTFYSGSAIVSATTAGFSDEEKNLREWNTSADRTGTSYKPGEQPSFSENTTLYAIWKDANTFDLTYYPNGATGSAYTIEDCKGEITLLSSSDTNLNYSYDGKKFLGWDTKADGSGTRYDADGKITVSGDTSLFAQWCTYNESTKTYTISSLEECYAILNATENKTEIKTNITLGIGRDAYSSYQSGILTIDSGYLSAMSNILKFTSGKTLSATFDGGSNTLDVNSNLFDKISNTGTVKNLKVSSFDGINASGSIANTNEGTISHCTVHTTIFGSGDYAGGIAGINSGTISGCTFYGEISTSSKYAGGITAYNTSTGTIDKTNTTSIKSSEITVSSSADDAYYGYVIGYNDGGTVSTEISAPTTSEYSKESYNVKTSTITAYTFELKRTAILTLSVTDASGGGAIYGNISQTQFSDASETGIVMTGKVNGTTATKTTTKYLTKGTYYVNLKNENVLSASTGTFSLTIK